MGVLGMSQLTTATPFAWPAACYILVGVGFALMVPAGSSAAMAEVPEGSSGIGSGLVNACRQIDDVLLETPGLESFNTVGGLAFINNTFGPDRASFLVRLRPWHERKDDDLHAFQILEGLKNDDPSKFTQFPDVRYRAGTSEIKNWIILAGAMSGRLQANVVDYVPCYRTEGGNGCAMGFAEWR